MSRATILATILIASGLPVVVLGGDDLLSFEERVQCQRAIEEVYWRHRIWPAENPDPKPTLEEMLPDAVLRERVATYLQESTALERVWSRPLTGDQLQVELDRMVRGTKKPGLLRELFAALDDDPLLAAECLARPVLVDRLARNWYSRDARFHSALRKQAEAALASRPVDVAGLRNLGGRYLMTEWRLAPEDKRGPSLDGQRKSSSVVDLDAGEWREQIERIADLFDVDRDPGTAGDPTSLLQNIPVGRISRLVEDRSRFVVTAVLSKERDRLRTATVTWHKRTFDAWWAEDGPAPTEVIRAAKPISPPVGGYVLRSPTNGGCTPDTWIALWYAPVSRYHTAVWTGTEMIVWGGEDDSPVNTGGRYDPAIDSWTATSTGAGVPTARAFHTAVWTGIEMIVWGGEDGDGQLSNSGGRYDPQSDLWSPTGTGIGTPAARSGHSAIWTGTTMIVWGGKGAAADLNTGGRYDPATDGWTATSTHMGVPAGRSGHTAVWTGEEMIVWGGGEYLNTGGRYNPVFDSWTATSLVGEVPEERAGHTAIWTGTEMIVWGGFDGAWQTYMNTGGRYDPATNRWTSTSLLPDVPDTRRYHTAVWTGTEMIVWGGQHYSSGTYNLNSGGRYDPVTNGWTATSTGSGVPAVRGGHSAVWTGTEMIIWGGYNSGSLETGGRYDPVSDSWIATASSVEAGVPPATGSRTAVWTGAEMIVWGGDLSSENTGGRYDPATDAWTATSTPTGVPMASTHHTAVWTGTELIVWGGKRSWAMNHGGAYNPVIDAWRATSTDFGVPTPREEHTAVWTGTEMIVWGGGRLVPVWDDLIWVSLNTGGRYDPQSDSWTATSTAAGVPAARPRHTAVWTGTEMIVWGGGSNYSTGGRYYPAIDRWLPTSTANGVPEGRAYPSAVWTGTEMIVWGGGWWNIFDTGGRYDPLTDQWSATATGAPAARSRHTAVWTGTEMIVWGGYGNGESLNTGGRYDPGVDSWTTTSVAAGVPAKRWQHAVVWTGAEMIVWGGSAPDAYLNSGGLYCVCGGDAASDWYPDVDGDGLGADIPAIPACEPPPNHVAVGGDCHDRYAACTLDCTDADSDGTPACAPDCDDANPYCTTDCTDTDGDGYCVTHDCVDTNPDTHPGASEVNDGLDNHCAGDLGYGLIDEITGICGFHNPADKDELSWPAQSGATGYEVVRSPHRQFQADCLGITTADTYWIDLEPVPAGVCHYYLVRSTQPNLGSWGTSYAGAERTAICP